MEAQAPSWLIADKALLVPWLKSCGSFSSWIALGFNPDHIQNYCHVISPLALGYFADEYNYIIFLVNKH